MASALTTTGQTTVPVRRGVPHYCQHPWQSKTCWLLVEVQPLHQDPPERAKYPWARRPSNGDPRWLGCGLVKGLDNHIRQVVSDDLSVFFRDYSESNSIVSKAGALSNSHWTHSTQWTVSRVLAASYP